MGIYSSDLHPEVTPVQSPRLPRLLPAQAAHVPRVSRPAFDAHPPRVHVMFYAPQVLRMRRSRLVSGLCAR